MNMTGTDIDEQRRPTLPGDILRHDILMAKNITQETLADAMGVSRYSINQLVNGRRSVTADMAIRLAKATSTTPRFWLNLQLAVDLYEASIELGSKLERVSVLIPEASDEELFEEV